MAFAGIFQVVPSQSVGWSYFGNRLIKTLPDGITNCVTCFQFQILLTRYEGGLKGPVVMFHGASVSSEIFRLDSIDANLVEYLVQYG